MQALPPLDTPGTIAFMWGALRRGLSRAGLLAAGAALACAAPAGAAGQPPPSDAFGINGGALFPDGNKTLPTARHTAAIGRSGLPSVRAVAWWDQIEPQAPDPRTGRHTYDWRLTDRIAEHLAREGLRWYVILGFATAWSSTTPGFHFTPARPGPFSEYAGAIARRYGRAGEFWRAHPELPYVPVQSFEVWNEPNLPFFWAPQPDPAAYADLYLGAREAVHAVDPAARVVVGGLSHSGGESLDAPAFLRRMVAARPALRGRLDAVGVHVYAPTAEDVLDGVADVRRALDELGERDVLLDVTETGWTTSGLQPFTPGAVDEGRRSRLLTRLVELLAGSDCGVVALLPYAWVTEENDRTAQAAWFGIADRATAELKPSGGAFVAAVRDAARTAPSTACGRPDLPRLRTAPRAAAPFDVRLARSCRARRLTVRLGPGAEPEPYARVALELPDGRRRTLSDPDGSGPATAPREVRVRLPRRMGAVRAVAFDALGRARATAEAALARCPPRRR